MNLNYSLMTPEERIEFLYNLNLTLLNDADLERCANYVLYACDKELANNKPINTNRNNERSNALDPAIETQAQTIKPRKGSNYYTKSTPPIPWDNPALADLAAAIASLQAQLENTEDSNQAYKLRRTITELRMDARNRLPEIKMNLTMSSPLPAEIDLEACGLDWTNAFHIKHVIKHYSELWQDDNTHWDMLWFDYLVEETNLAPWKKHILIRFIDGAHSIIVARELSEQFNKPVQPGYTSKVMRSIYREIASTAEKMEIERNTPVSQWRRCPGCGNSHPNHEIWWRVGQRKCKQCLAQARKTNLEEEQGNING